MSTTILLINLSAEIWLRSDFDFIRRWQFVCSDVYGTEISRIIKEAPNQFRVICK